METRRTTARKAEMPATRDPAWVRRALIAFTLGFLGVLIVLPLLVVFAKALSKGIGPYLAAIATPDSLAAIRLTVLVAIIAVSVNLAFGIAAGWAIARFRFRGKGFLTTLIELPIAVSPVISGMIFVLLWGRSGPMGAWLAGHGVRVIFAVPGIVLATIFVTAPIIAREIIPLLQSIGTEEEDAARVLGAGPWQTFFRITIPNIRWGLLYGVILCNARAMGEFGAVSVVSGHIRGETNTLPLQVEILYNEYDFQGAFAVASLLTFLAIVTLVAKGIVERKM